VVYVRHEVLQQSASRAPHLLDVHIHTAQRRNGEVAETLVVIHTENGDLLRDRQSEPSADLQHLEPLSALQVMVTAGLGSERAHLPVWFCRRSHELDSDWPQDGRKAERIRQVPRLLNGLTE